MQISHRISHAHAECKRPFAFRVFCSWLHLRYDLNVLILQLLKSLLIDNRHFQQIQPADDLRCFDLRQVRLRQCEQGYSFDYARKILFLRTVHRDLAYRPGFPIKTFSHEPGGSRRKGSHGIGELVQSDHRIVRVEPSQPGHRRIFWLKTHRKGICFPGFKRQGRDAQVHASDRLIGGSCFYFRILCKNGKSGYENNKYHEKDKCQTFKIIIH